MVREKVCFEISMCTTAAYVESFLAEFILEGKRPKLMIYPDEDESVKVRKNNVVTLELRESSAERYYFRNASVQVSVSKNLFNESLWSKPFDVEIVFPEGSYHRALLISPPTTIEAPAK